MATGSFLKELNFSLDSTLPSEQTTSPTWREEAMDLSPSWSHSSQEVMNKALPANNDKNKFLSFIAAVFQMT